MKENGAGGINPPSSIPEVGGERSPSAESLPELALYAPDGRRVQQLPQSGKAKLGPLDQCGVWRIAASADSAPWQEIACNLSSREESDLRTPEGLNTETELAGMGLTGRPYWFYLVAAAWALAGLEWYLYQRRWIS